MERKRTVLGLGEVLWDCFADGRRPGGAPANVAFHANQLGLTGIVVSRVGQDSLGEALRDSLQAGGLTTEAITTDAEHPTGTVTVDTTRPDDPQYTIHENVAWDFLEWTPQLEQMARDARAVCYGTLAQRSPVSRATIQRFLDEAKNALRVCDVNLRQTYFTREILEESLRQAHLVKLNNEEVAILAEQFGVSAEWPAFCAWMSKTFDVAEICITCGADGCWLVESDGSLCRDPGRSVSVVDTVGSGDAFTAALIYGTLENWPPARKAEFANSLGALVASRSGSGLADPIGK